METELNEKLARWAGIHQEHHPFYGLIWCDADGEIVGFLPDFTISLDYCFKWLVPLIPAVRITSGTVKEGVRYVQAEVFPTDIDDASYYERDGNAALALCKAIEKMID